MNNSLVALLFVLVFIAIASLGCSPAATPTLAATTAPTSAPTTKAPELTATKPPATQAPTAAPATATPAQTGAGKIKIYYGGNAMVELISPSGMRVMVDVYNPQGLSSPATANDILLTTHTHGDHINNDFLKSFPGKQLYVKTGELQAGGVKVTGIAAGHNSGDKPQPENGTDYIFLIEMNGLRIAHFGDIGQDALTQEQLTALGKVDIAVMQFENSYSAMDAVNKKGFNMMNQVAPRLVIPTHINTASVKLLGETWVTYYTEKAFISVGQEELSSDARVAFVGSAQVTSDTRVIFMGSKAKSWADLSKATLVDW